MQRLTIHEYASLLLPYRLFASDAYPDALALLYAGDDNDSLVIDPLGRRW